MDKSVRNISTIKSCREAGTIFAKGWCGVQQEAKSVLEVLEGAKRGSPLDAGGQFRSTGEYDMRAFLGCACLALPFTRKSGYSERL